MDQDNYSLAPLFAESDGAPVSISLVVRRKHDPASGWFVALYQLVDATVFLGCLCDSRGLVKEWLEIWVQTVLRTEHANGPADAQLNNAYLDQKWRQRAAALEQLAPDSVFAGPWQEEHPLPVYFTSERWKPVAPSNPRLGDHAAWELCREDAVLKGAKLPAYSESTFRYLYNSSQAGNSMFVALDEAAPRNQRVIAADAESGFVEGLIPFNRHAGLLFIRKHSPLRLRAFKRILEGYGWQGSGQAAEKISPTAAYEPFREDAYFQNNHGLIFSGRRGREGRVLECFLLKLVLFQEAVAQVAAVIKSEGRPFLNLHADDFRVRLPVAAWRLPSCWGFELSLCRTSESMATDIAGKGFRFFKPLGGQPASIYQPKQISSARSGHGSVRLRNVRAGDDGSVVCEGTLADVEVFAMGPSDLLWIELPARGERLAFHARPLSEQNLAAKEIRFETLSRIISAPMREALTALKGMPLEGVAYKAQPVTSSPCDLYSLAVIALEILIDTEKVSLAVALDECFSLAREVARQGAGLPIASRRAKALEEEPRFWDSLGPQNICQESLTREEACALIPPELWWGCFDVLIRMFPGADPAGWARDLGDVNPFALESCFPEAMKELDGLVERTRSLLFLDWTSNRETRNILDEFSG
ncbi:MAG TPA: hypothetical protein VH595_10845 [Verrucomicrobiae bacterium]|jgi:hypothetical protein|nr:hypothetical protein [Verrucomicrobiae bacterium]